MSEPHNVLCLDVGERRIGVALTSLEARLPSALLTIDRQKQPDVFAVIAELIKEHSASMIVVGLPRGMSGQETAQTAIARQFAADLEQNCTAVVVMQDEAGTSIAAEEKLQAIGKPYAKGDIDKEAAVIILHDWLEGQAVGA